MLDCRTHVTSRPQLHLESLDIRKERRILQEPQENSVSSRWCVFRALRLPFSHFNLTDPYSCQLFIRRDRRCRHRFSNAMDATVSPPLLPTSFAHLRSLPSYVNKNRDLTKKFVQHAESRGIKGLFITVDAPQLGRREKDMRMKFEDSGAKVQNENGEQVDRNQGAARAISVRIRLRSSLG